MKTEIYVRDRDGANILSATIEADSVLVYPRARWNNPQDTDQHGTAMLWTYDDQRSIVVSPLNALLIDGSTWQLQAVGFDGGMRVFVSPVEGYADPFAEKGGEKGGEYQFIAKGADVRHGTQLIATATSSNYAKRIAESLTLYRGKLASDRRDQRRRAEKGITTEKGGR